MTFDELWAQVKGLSDTAKVQEPLVLTASTKKKLERRSPEEVAAIVAVAIDEVNHGSITSLLKLPTPKSRITCTADHFEQEKH